MYLIITLKIYCEQFLKMIYEYSKPISALKINWAHKIGNRIFKEGTDLEHDLQIFIYIDQYVEDQLGK